MKSQLASWIHTPSFLTHGFRALPWKKAAAKPRTRRFQPCSQPRMGSGLGLPTNGAAGPPTAERPRILFLLSQEKDTHSLRRSLDSHPSLVFDGEWKTDLCGDLGGDHQILVLGLDTRQGRGLLAVRRIRDRFPTTPFLVVVRDGQESLGRKARRLGALTFLTETQARSSLLGLHLRFIMIYHHWYPELAKHRSRTLTLDPSALRVS